MSSCDDMTGEEKNKIKEKKSWKFCFYYNKIQPMIPYVESYFISHNIKYYIRRNKICYTDGTRTSYNF